MFPPRSVEMTAKIHSHLNRRIDSKTERQSPEGHKQCDLGHCEAIAIFGRRDSEMLPEDAPHRADVAESCSRTDVLDREIGLLEQSPRLIDPDAAYEFGRRLVEVRAAPAAQRA